MTSNTYTLDENASNLWLKYDVTETGVIEFSCDAPYAWSDFIGIAKNDAKAPVSMKDQIQDESTLDQANPARLSVYHAVFSAKEGDALYILVNIKGDATGKKLTLTPACFRARRNHRQPLSNSRRVKRWMYLRQAPTIQSG